MQKFRFIGTKRDLLAYTVPMVFDLHNDFLTAVKRTDYDKVINSYARDGVRGIIFAVYTTEIKPSAEEFMKYELPQTPFKAWTAIEDLGSVQSTDDYEFLKKVSPSYVSLTWNGANRLAGGVGSETALTECGVTALKALASLDIPLDLSHLSDKSFYDALDKCGSRLLVTHTAARTLCNHPRCITDEMAKLVAGRGGIIGVAAIPDFLESGLNENKTCTRRAYLRHITHLADLIGTDHVAIGTDFNGGKRYPIGLSEYGDFASLGYDMENIGFTAEEITSIFYKNAYRFFGI